MIELQFFIIVLCLRIGRQLALIRLTTSCLDKINYILPAELDFLVCACVRAQTHMCELHAAMGYCPAKCVV